MITSNRRRPVITDGPLVFKRNAAMPTLPGVPVRFGSYYEARTNDPSRFIRVTLQELGVTGKQALMHQIVLLGKQRGLRPLSLFAAEAMKNELEHGLYLQPRGETWVMLAVRQPEDEMLAVGEGRIIISRQYGVETKDESKKWQVKDYDPQSGPAWLTACTRERFIFEEPFTPS